VKRNQSRHNYKGYVIKLVFETFSGGGFQIIKDFEVKEFILRQTYFNFILSNEALKKAQNYIDNFGDKLEEKTVRVLGEYSKKVLKNPSNFPKNIVELVSNNFIKKEKMKIAIIDIETTHFLEKGGKIIEIGIVELDLETGEREIIFSEFCHEAGITLKEVEDSWIVENSDITVEDIRQSKKLFVLQPKIQEIINRYPLGATAFNNKFDFGFLENRGFVFPKKLACPMKLSVDVLQIPPTVKMVRAGYNNYKTPNVQEAYDFFFPNNDYIEKHRGADDAFHEAEIVFELYKRGIFTID